MRTKILLLLCLLAPGILIAQDTIRSLIITEARLDRADQAYVEITNMSDSPVQMGDFEFGTIRPWGLPYTGEPNRSFRLPENILQPGESYVIATVLDFTEEQYPKDPDNYNDNITKEEWWTLADMQFHRPEANGDETDSVIGDHHLTFDVFNREAWYIEQHLENGDSVVIDQVNGVFDNPDGTNYDKPYDAAGFKDASRDATLVRRFDVKTGNLDYANARGIGLEDSEWMPIPHLFASWEPDRAVFWTVGNHGPYNLDENTLESDILDVDWTSKTITAPWGIRNNDDFMMAFEKKPGVAWHYHLSPERADSAYNSARTGDKITIYVCGNDLDVETFDIIVEGPTADANIVVPKFVTADGGFYGDYINSGSGEMFWVTEKNPEMDTITYSLFGIPYATQVDTLLKYLEKAPQASLEIEWIDGIERTNVVNGDVLKVTAENGDIKRYYIKVDEYRPNHNAYLSAITWPDIPEFYRDIFGWIGDTIPNFDPNIYNYKVMVPVDVDGIPGLVAKKQALNSKVIVDRATTLNGTPEQRTITFTVTAEDDTTTRIYKVQLEKEKDLNDIQPFEAEPFLSELLFWGQWSNGFVEIANPGNQPLDLSNYMIAFAYMDPPTVIQSYSGEEDWLDRYRKYVPGYKWLDEASWAVTPGRLEQDLSVNPIIQPGDVFVAAGIHSTGQSGYPWFASEQTDIDFQHNPWGEEVAGNSAAREWWGGNWYMFKILNDSVKQGLKPANDINDFELIETWGMGDGTRWVVGGKNADMITSYTRKPEYWKGKTGFTESFGTTPEDSEWTWKNMDYYRSRGAGWPGWVVNVAKDIGQHFMHEVTDYKSTITSIVYKVSDGYSLEESIRGVRTGTTVAQLFENIVKANQGQSLTIKATADGSILASNVLLSNKDTLVVLSADSTNTSKYILEVTEDGLNSDAVLTSDKYTIEIIDDPMSTTVGTDDQIGAGTISGFEFGTQLKTVLINVNVPQGASLTIIDDDGAYVPLTMLNYDTSYVAVTVNSNTYFELVAEDGVTTIVYQLQPQASFETAFITSNVYSVSQKNLLVEFVPRGTATQEFLSNLIPSTGATIKVIDKLGHERTDGQIVQDDRLVVTAPNGVNQTIYYLSMLRTKYIITSDYLAYVTSNVYTVNQLDKVIADLPGATDIATFYSRIDPAVGATATVVDADGNEKTSGNLNAGDMLKVTSGDGKVEVMYTLEIATSANLVNDFNINVYPNPTSGNLSISGVEVGGRIQIFNSMGTNIRDLRVLKNTETVSLNGQPAGIYLVTVSAYDKVVGKFKIVKK